MENKILIVDDDPDVLISLSDLLKDEGFDVKPVSSGKEALKVFSEFHPSVVITDMKMSGMSGLELLHRLRKINSYVQIIILTGYASVKNVAEAMANNGAFAYFQKPISDFEMFFGSVRQAFEKERLIRENYHWEGRLKLANARFETIFENMDAVIYVSDMDTYELIYANSTFKELFGDYIDENEKKNNISKGKKCWELLQKTNDGPCSFCTNPKLVDVNGKPLNPYTWEFYNPLVKRWFSIKDQAIYWHDGRVVRLETAMDITPYYKLSREVEKSKRFQAIGVLAGGISHDLNNTLAAILGNINLAQLIASDPESDEYFVAAENGIMQAKTLSGKLLALAKGDTPVKKIVDMKELIRKFIDENQFGSKVELTILNDNSNCEEIDNDNTSNFIIDVDVEQIKIALYNIFTNASEAMNSRGTIKVNLKRHYSSTKNCNYVMTSIYDNGKGIAPSNIDKIFDPYFTTKFPGKERGTGLGLSIAYSIIKKHGGYIDIDSVEGKGTQVDICLPITKTF
ncbi:MAG: response regulator [Desulfamplus sp.]|nr:response regulator [Desulfamplus sp.]